MGNTRDQVRGYVEEAKGALKEATGKLMGNPTLEVKGKIERNLGRAQATIVKLRREVKKASK